MGSNAADGKVAADTALVNEQQVMPVSHVLVSQLMPAQLKHSAFLR